MKVKNKLIKRKLCVLRLGEQGDECGRPAPVPALLRGPTQGAPPRCPPAEPLHEGEHHHPLQDLLAGTPEPVHLQGNLAVNRPLSLPALRNIREMVRGFNFHDTLLCLNLFQINRSDSDSSTLSKKSPFIRNASERRSMRMKKVGTTHLLPSPPDVFVCQYFSSLQ